MPEWLVERGIGETRAALVADGQIIEARIELDGTVAAGTVLRARLKDKGTGGRNGIAGDDGGTDYLLASVPRDIAQGECVSIEVTRPALPGPEPWKRPLAKIVSAEPRGPQSLGERLRSTADPVRDLAFPAASDALSQAGWDDLIDEARSGRCDFAGGSLGLFATPAMTLIDVDGALPPAELALAGARASAEAIRRLDIGGSIGIDLPTASGKPARLAAAEAVDSALPKPFERTSVNGFGFLHIIRPRSRPSLLELAKDRAAFEARALLRRAALDSSGPKRLAANPALVAVLESNPGWTDELARQVGGAITLRAEPSIPIHGGYAEKP